MNAQNSLNSNFGKFLGNHVLVLRDEENSLVVEILSVLVRHHHYLQSAEAFRHETVFVLFIYLLLQKLHYLCQLRYGCRNVPAYLRVKIGKTVAELQIDEHERPSKASYELAKANKWLLS